MKWYNRLTVTKKLMITFLMVSFIFIIEGYIGLSDINQLGMSIDDVYNEDRIIFKFRDMFHNSRTYRILVFQHIGSSDIQEMKSFKEELKKQADEIDSHLKIKEQYRLTVEEDELFRSAIAGWNELYKNYIKIIKDL